MARTGSFLLFVLIWRDVNAAFGDTEGSEKVLKQTDAETRSGAGLLEKLKDTEENQQNLKQDLADLRQVFLDRKAADTKLLEQLQATLKQQQSDMHTLLQKGVAGLSAQRKEDAEIVAHDKKLVGKVRRLSLHAAI